jgi:hypothetical protein
MNREEIIRTAKAVGLGEVDDDGDIWCSDGFYTEEIDSFAQFVYDAGRKAEREACAKVCIDIRDATSNQAKGRTIASHCAIAIRERGAP